MVINMNESMETNINENTDSSITSLSEQAAEKILEHDITGAYEILVEAIKADVENIEILNLIARCYFLWGDFERAELCWKKVLELDTANPEASLSLEDLQDPPFQFWLKRYYEALNQVENRNYEAARNALWELLQEKDCFVGIYQLLGLCYLAEADRYSARRVWIRGLEWDTSNKPLLNYLNIYEEDASNAVELDEVSEKWIHWPALPRIRIAWLLSGVLCTVLLVQGVSYLAGQRDYDSKQSGKNKQQVEYFQEKIEKGNQPQMVLAEKQAVGFLPEEVKNRGEENSMAGADYDLEQEKWYYSEGYQAYLAGDYKKATSNLGMVVSMQSKSFLHREALYYLARVYYINSDFKNAEKYFLDYTRDFPSTNYYDESLFYLGCIYYFDQQEDKARQALERLREVVPDSGYLTSKMAITLLGAQ